VEVVELKTDVCIVGGGPGGALLAYILASQNIRTVLIERHHEINKEFRGEHLNEVGEMILKKQGMYEKIEKYGLLLMDKIEYWDYGQLIKTITPEANKQHVGIHVPQNHLLNVLFESARAYDSYQELLGTTVTSLLKNEEGQYIGVKAKRKQDDITVHCSVIIGADGRFSTVRTLAGIPTTIIKHGYDILWAKIPSPEGWEPTIKLAMVEGKQLAIFTQFGGFIQIGWGIEEDSYAALKKQSFKQFTNRIKQAFPDLTETVDTHITECKDFVVLKVQSCKCETWVQDGLVIMGDAAHTMSPTGAIGVNSALEDANILGNILLKAFETNDYSTLQLKQFENLRRPDVEKQQREQMYRESTFKENFVRTS
jgi:2-polyprenyl-6-methoxyphenol hydroxylase-like FAD-dependent oxidoreductase